ncbi:hypothetical protein [Paramicrobacterium agarici]|uniref:hypothetical protein n=1 Tax=Paramicrobacterium agarici TaxID=630514 RepID=UPI0011520AA8|nr:hypothetical protein [Microbacterium agarici]TQO23605.1 hypothetical protein FB385_2462 [Microbacterium agarici]
MKTVRRVALMSCVLIAAASLVSSNASNLAMTGALLSSHSEVRCADAAEVQPSSADAVATAVSVTLADATPECAGADVSIALIGMDGTLLSSVQTTLPESIAASMSLRVPEFKPFAVRTAAMTIASWALPTTWTFDGTGASCEVFDVRTEQPMPGASCSLGEPLIEWASSDWKNLRVSFIPVTKSLPTIDGVYPASYYAYYTFSFTVKPDSPEWWSWGASGFRDSRNNWCSVALEPLSDGLWVTGRTGDNIAAENTWGILFDIGQNGVTEIQLEC